MNPFRKAILIITAMSCIGFSVECDSKTLKVRLESPGQLEATLPLKKTSKESVLAISGTLNNDDIRYLRMLCGGDSAEARVHALDLSGVSFSTDKSPGFASGPNGETYRVRSPYSIPDGMFDGCTISALTLPAKLDSIGAYAIRRTRLSSLHIPDGVYVHPLAICLDSCLTDLRLPYMSTALIPSDNGLPNLRNIVYAGFDYMSGGSFVDNQEIESVTVEGLSGHIDGYTFTNCPKLKSIKFLGPISSTGGLRFTHNCPALENITVGGLAINYCLTENQGAPLFKGTDVRGAIYSTEDTEKLPTTPTEIIVSSTEMVGQLKTIAEWEMRQMTADNSGFLRMVSFNCSEGTLELAKAAGLTEIAGQLTDAQAKAKTFDDIKSKLQILKESAAYKSDSIQWTLSRAMPDDSLLTLTRERFNLDSIAGQGDDLSRIKNLLYWVHDLVPHDGSSPWPDCELNCRDIYDVCMRDNRGVNCRMLGMMLTEALLAEGIPARYLTCESKQWDTDNDCHVICIAWSESLDKWVWVDPTFAAFVTDENGVMLHPGEVRYRMQHDLPLVLNEDANWNHQTRQTKKEYLDYYMAKNLYIMSYNTISQANPEGRASHPQGRHVALVPKGFNYSRNTINTSDETRFWAAPEE